MKILNFILLSVLSYFAAVANPDKSWKELAPPEVNGVWIQPARNKPARPVWGNVNGLQVGLSPMPGPRGLLRIYTPYLGHSEGIMINYVAIEPIPAGTKFRGFSELEMSTIDNKQGKRFWSSDDSLAFVPGQEEYPARGLVSGIGDKQALTVFIFVEPFQNGAKVYIRLRFLKERPYEVEIATFKQKGSAPLKHCVVTATMGNFARLRNIYLEKVTKSTGALWSDYSGDAFAPHVVFPMKEMIRDWNGGAWFIAAPNEKNPSDVEYSLGTNLHWKYKGKVATQYWHSKNPDPSLEGLVNGRIVYWASNSPIPGGIAIENFEMKEAFRNGATYVFGINPSLPLEFINRLRGN